MLSQLRDQAVKEIEIVAVVKDMLSLHHRGLHGEHDFQLSHV